MGTFWMTAVKYAPQRLPLRQRLAKSCMHLAFMEFELTTARKYHHQLNLLDYTA